MYLIRMYIRISKTAKVFRALYGYYNLVFKAGGTVNLNTIIISDSKQNIYCLYTRNGPYIRPISISCRIPDIKTIRISGYLAGYPVICRMSGV